MTRSSYTMMPDDTDSRASVPPLPGGRGVKDPSHEQATPHDETKQQRYTRLGIAILAKSWFLIALGVLVVLAWAFPNVGKDDGWIKPEYTVHYGAIALIFLVTGLTLSSEALLSQMKNIKLHLLTQITSLLIFPSFVFGLCNLIKATSHGAIDEFLLVGLVFLGCACTSVASNIVMTRDGGGSAEAATIEVVIGNVLGIFLTPLLVFMFTDAPGWEFGKPLAAGGLSGSEGLSEIYRQVSKQMGLSLLLPLVRCSFSFLRDAEAQLVGQVIRNLFPKQITWFAQTFHIGKLSSCMVLVITWSVFSNQFSTGAFSAVSPASIILVVFLNIALYLGFTGLCILLARPPPPARKGSDNGTIRKSRWRRAMEAWEFDRGETTAVCFCAAAKGLVVGSPVLDILYGGYSPQRKAIMSIPLVLYQGQQIAIAQLLTFAFKRYNRPRKEERLPVVGEATLVASNATEKTVMARPVERT